MRRRLVLLTVLVFIMLMAQIAVALACTVPAMTRSDIQIRAGAGVGYSYWWGKGRWSTGVNTSDGSCCGTCGSCSHWASKTLNARCGSHEAGVTERGADCSGYAATAWQVNTTCSTFSIASGGHPYSTYSFRYGSQHWYTFSSLSSLRNMDAAVRYDNVMHHMVLFNMRDSYGTPLVYEAKGCAYGIRYNARTLDSNWVGVRRDNLI